MKKIVKILLFGVFILSVNINAQIQIGEDINGEASLELLGSATAISNDGSIIAIGVERNDSNGTDSGKVRVFKNVEGNWIQLGNDIYGSTQGGYFGNCVSLSLDGTILAVGAARSSSHVQVFKYNGNDWVQLGEDFIRESNDQGTISISLSNDGNLIAVGKPSNDDNGPGTGQVRIYEYDGTNWAQFGLDINGKQTDLLLDERFGYSVSLSADGNKLVVGAPGTGLAVGRVRVYEYVDNNWTQMGSDVIWNSQGDRVGASVSISDDGKRIVYGAPRNLDSNVGHVRVLDYTGTQWETNKAFSINESSYNHKYGNSVSLSSNGNRLAIGDPLNDAGLGNKYGLVELYNYDTFGHSWSELGTFITGESAYEEFGTSVSLSGDGNTVMAGAIKNDANGLDAQGKIRVFDINFNNLFSVVSFDIKNNDCASSSVLANNVKIKMASESGDILSFTSIEGFSKALVQKGTFTVSPILNDSRFTVSPTSEEVVFNNLGEEKTVNFCVSSNQIVNDVSITLLPINQSRPGFDSKYRIHYQNLGTVIENGNITIQFNDALQEYVEGTQIPNIETSNMLTYDYSNLQPFESRNIDFVLKTKVPPIVNSEDILTLVATIDIADLDVNLDDNEFELNQEVVNSFDPNDKQVLEGDEISLEEASEYLNYIVRFQNTGSASAISVRVRDVLEDKLDWDTFSPISSSHSYFIKITEGNLVDFIFDNILLPAEQDDEPNSHGFVAFKIKPKTDVIIGDVIQGEANIYFDFNSPIITNTVNTEIINALSVNENKLELSINVYPNPSKGKIFVNSKNKNIIQKISIYSVLGELILEQTKGVNQNLDQISIKHLSKGIYFFKVDSEMGNVIIKVFKN